MPIYFDWLCSSSYKITVDAFKDHWFWPLKTKKTIPEFPAVNDINIFKHQMLTSHHPLQLSTFKVLFSGKTTSFGNFSAVAY